MITEIQSKNRLFNNIYFKIHSVEIRKSLVVAWFYGLVRQILAW